MKIERRLSPKETLIGVTWASEFGQERSLSRHKKSPTLLQVTGPVIKKPPVPNRFWEAWILATV
jgi:hypothetical protein